MRSGGDHRVCSMSSRVAFKLRACTTSDAIPPSCTSAIESGAWAYASDIYAYCTGCNMHCVSVSDEVCSQPCQRCR